MSENNQTKEKILAYTSNGTPHLLPNASVHRVKELISDIENRQITEKITPYSELILMDLWLECKDYIKKSESNIKPCKLCGSIVGIEHYSVGTLINGRISWHRCIGIDLCPNCLSKVSIKHPNYIYERVIKFQYQNGIQINHVFS